MAFVVQNKKELISLLQRNQVFIKNYGVRRLGIFGSFARNENNDDSDIDFLVEFEKEKKTYKNFIRLAFFLEEISGRKIELLTPQSMSPYIGPHIIKQLEDVPLSD